MSEQTPHTTPTHLELADSLVAAEEAAVETYFGYSYWDMADGDQLTLGRWMKAERALVFVDRLRAGDDEPTAAGFAKNLTALKVGEYFPSATADTPASEAAYAASAPTPEPVIPVGEGDDSAG